MYLRGKNIQVGAQNTHQHSHRQEQSKLTKVHYLTISSLPPKRYTLLLPYYISHWASYELNDGLILSWCSWLPMHQFLTLIIPHFPQIPPFFCARSQILVIMARLSFLFAVLIAVAALTSSVSALPVEETVAPVEPADMPSSGAYCVCNMHGWSAHCGMCTSDETYRGCHNEWNSYCS